MKYKQIILVSIISLLFLNACKISKRILDVPAQKTVRLSDVYKQVLENEPDFKSMDISKVSITVSTNEQSFSIKGYFRMITDSVILISAQPLAGIEVGRVFINHDSLVVLDRINSQYYSVKMDSLKQVTGLDFNTIQKLFSNQLFLSNIDKDNVSKQMFEVYPLQQGYSLKSNEEECYFNQNFIVNSELRIEKSVLIDKVNPQSLTCEYANFTQTDAFSFPQKIKLAFFDGQKLQNIDISITKVEFNRPININFSIPEKYTKGDIGNFKF